MVVCARLDKNSLIYPLSDGKEIATVSLYLWWRARWPWGSCTRQSRREGPWASPLAPERSWCGPWRRRRGPPPWGRREDQPRPAAAPRAEASSTDSRLTRTTRSKLAWAGRPGRSLEGPGRTGCSWPTRPPRTAISPRARRCCRSPWCCSAACTGRTATLDTVPPSGAGLCTRRGKNDRSGWHTRPRHRSSGQTAPVNLVATAATAALGPSARLQHMNQLHQSQLRATRSITHGKNVWKNATRRCSFWIFTPFYEKLLSRRHKVLKNAKPVAIFLCTLWAHNTKHKVKEWEEYFQNC